MSRALTLRKIRGRAGSGLYRIERLLAPSGGPGQNLKILTPAVLLSQPDLQTDSLRIVKFVQGSIFATAGRVCAEGFHRTEK